MIIQNILPDSLKKHIYNSFNSHDTPWYFNETINYPSEEEIGTYQFTHKLFENNAEISSLFPIARNIIYFFEKETNIRVKGIHRVKANLTTKQNLNDTQIEKLKHQDVQIDFQEPPYENFLSLIYYVNDSDGDTIIYADGGEEEERITPQANTLLYFNSSKWHAGLFPTQHKKRIVINFIVALY